MQRRPQVPVTLKSNAKQAIKDALLFWHGNPGKNIGSTGGVATSSAPGRTQEGAVIDSFAAAWSIPGGYSAVPITVIVDFRTIGTATGGCYALWSSKTGIVGNGALYFRYNSGNLEILKSQVAIIASVASVPPVPGYTVAFTYDGTNWKLAAGGKVIGSGANSQSCVFDTPTVGIEGGTPLAGANSSNAVYRGLVVIPRVLTDQELVAATTNPYSFIAGPVSLLPPTIGGGTSYSYTASGGMVLSGAIATVRGRVKAASGGIQTGGAAGLARGTVRGTSGGMTFAGAATRAVGKAVTAAGGLVFGGAAISVRGVARAAAGGVVFAGQAGATFFSAVQSRVVNPVGGIVIAGSALVARSVRKAAAGGITFAGHALMRTGPLPAFLSGLLPIFRRRRR